MKNIGSVAFSADSSIRFMTECLPAFGGKRMFLSEKLKKSYTVRPGFAVENSYCLCYNSDNLGIEYLCINIQKSLFL